MTGGMGRGKTCNKLLLGMAPEDRARLEPLLSSENLASRQYLERRGEWQVKIYFIESAVVSNLETSDIPVPLEVGVVGCEGIVGASAICKLLPQRDSRVQIAGGALALEREAFQKQLDASPSLLHYLLRSYPDADRATEPGRQRRGPGDGAAAARAQAPDVP
ncbi:cyclic nucleotide-binding domain-containing protein [Novosphingobium lindaniclasticum]|uniref:hypothetical protein n=1 Tax=Novosphingobium lindaniclasticum TaxID=1329895 RepID=UPI0003F9FD8D|nr:hypothetical protein [Novosphingobium lindaniclasticum]